MVVFGGGAVSGGVSILAIGVQHSYYRNARDLKRALEKKLGLDKHAIATTKGMGGKRKRIAKVSTFQNVMLGALIVADLTGLGAAIAHAERAPKPAMVEVAVQVSGASTASPAPVVFSRNGRIATTSSAVPGKDALIRVRSGNYTVSVLVGGKVCSRNAIVTAAPLQAVAMSCGPPAKHRQR
jgi:hypothetical protein